MGTADEHRLMDSLSASIKVSNPVLTWQGQGHYHNPMESTIPLANAPRTSRVPKGNGSKTTANPPMIYFAAGGGLIKIGFSTKVRIRICSIRLSSPVPIALIGVHKGGLAIERDLHRRFAHLRRHGEWFDDCLEIRDYVFRTTSRDLAKHDPIPRVYHSRNVQGTSSEPRRVAPDLHRTF